MTWVDPVCAMSVDADNAPRLIVNNVEFRFCSNMCRNAFSERPGRYLKAGDAIGYKTEKCRTPVGNKRNEVEASS